MVSFSTAGTERYLDTGRKIRPALIRNTREAEGHRERMPGRGGCMIHAHEGNGNQRDHHGHFTAEWLTKFQRLWQ